MSNPVFLAHPDNYVIAASLTSSSASSIYPLANVKLLPISKPFRTTGVTSEYIEVDLGSAKQVTLVALINHNLTSGATITVKAGASANPSTITQTITWRKYDAFILLNNTYRYWRIAIADTGNTSGFLSVGYVMLGVQTTAPGFGYGAGNVDAFTNLMAPTEFNVPHNSVLAYQVQQTLTFNNVTDAEVAVMRALFLEVYKNIYPFFWIPDAAVLDGYLMRFVNDFLRAMEVNQSVEARLIEDSRGAVIVS